MRISPIKTEGKMIIRSEKAVVRASDDIEMRNYITKELSQSISLAVAKLDGIHPKTKSLRSDRAYYIFEGEGIIEIDREIHNIKTGDAIYVPKDTEYSIQGKLKFIVINSPPFDSSKEAK